MIQILIKKNIVFIALILLIPLILLTCVSYKVDPSRFNYIDININSKYISINAFNLHSIKAYYSSYSVTYENGNLYVIYRDMFPILKSNDKSSTGWMKIPNNYPNLKKIYLSNGKKNLLIWENGVSIL